MTQIGVMLSSDHQSKCGECFAPTFLRFHPSSAIIQAMTQTKNKQLAALAKELVDAAAQKDIALRVLGGVAIHMTCPSIETHSALQRTINDLDLVAARKDFDALAELLAARGVTRRAHEPAQMTFDGEGIEIELSDTDFREDHHIDLSARLGLASPTLPLADLLLIKLQRKQFDEKDIQDSIALLIDHRVAREEAEEQISHAYIAQLTRGDWGRFHTVYANTITLEKMLPKYLEPEEAQLVWRRIELIQGEMDRQPKSLTWMANQFVRRPSQVPR